MHSTITHSNILLKYSVMCIYRYVTFTLYARTRKFIYETRTMLFKVNRTTLCNRTK